MKDFLLHPINFFRKEIQVNNAIEEALFQNDEVSNAKIRFVYFFKIANLMLLFMHFIVYLAIIFALVTMPFNLPISLFSIFPPLLFLLILRLFQTRWLPKVREVQMKHIGLDITPIVERMNETE